MNFYRFKDSYLYTKQMLQCIFVFWEWVIKKRRERIWISQSFEWDQMRIIEYHFQSIDSQSIFYYKKNIKVFWTTDSEIQ